MECCPDTIEGSRVERSYISFLASRDFREDLAHETVRANRGLFATGGQNRLELWPNRGELANSSRAD
jgi:hypothetical protein